MGFDYLLSTSILLPLRVFRCPTLESVLPIRAPTVTAFAEMIERSSRSLECLRAQDAVVKSHESRIPTEHTNLYLPALDAAFKLDASVRAWNGLPAVSKLLKQSASGLNCHGINRNRPVAVPLVFEVVERPKAGYGFDLRHRH